MAPQQRHERDRYWAAFGEWVGQRLAEQKPDRWTQQRLSDELARIDIAVTRNWVNQVINGSQPSPDLRRGIERLLGDFPEPAGVGDVGDSADLIRALGAQTAAITALVDQVKALVAAQPAPTELATALVELVRSGLLGGAQDGEPVGGAPRK
jgi:hypothetical protein